MIAGVRALRLVSDALCIGMSFAVEQTDASIQLLPLLSSHQSLSSIPLVRTRNDYDYELDAHINASFSFPFVRYY
jgi:hypothetical protein